MTNQTKLLISSSLLAVAGWGLYLFHPRPPVTQIVYQDRVVHVDRVVTKDVVRTLTKPDGTKVVTETKYQDRLVEKEVVKTLSQSTPALPRYSLGLSIRPNFSDLRYSSQTYEIEGAKRIGQSPFWITASASARGDLKDPGFSLGIRFEF